MAPGGGLEPPNHRVNLYHREGFAISQRLYLSDIRSDMNVSPATSTGDLDTTAIVEKIVSDPRFEEYLYNRYRRDYAYYVYRNAKLIPKVLENPTILKTLSYRKAKAVIEAITPVRDFAEIFKINLDIDTKLLRKHLPKKKTSEITNSIIEYEIKIDEEKRKSIIDQAVESIEKMPAGKWKLAATTDFFTGLRASEIAYMFRNWNVLKKLDLEKTVLITLDYDRDKKKAYITLIPKKLYEILNKYLPLHLSDFYWLDNIREYYGVKISIFRKAFNAITAGYLDESERDLLQGRLSKTQVRHYIKHILEISRKYYEAFEPYLHILDKLDKELQQINLK